MTVDSRNDARPSQLIRSVPCEQRDLGAVECFPTVDDASYAVDEDLDGFNDVA